MKKTTIIGMFALFMCMPPALAARLPVHEAAESPEYGRKFGGMIGRGLLNVTTSFVDLFVDTANETKNGPPLVGTLVGIGKGAGCTVLRALSGGLDLLTFWVPGFNGMPVSESYENCLGAESEQAMSPSGYPAQAGWTEPGETAPGTPGSNKKEEKPRYTK